MTDVQFDEDLQQAPAPVILSSRAASSPVVAALIRCRVVAGERSARLAVVAAAALAVVGAFTSLFFSSPARGVGGVRYADLSAAEREEVPPAERAYLEHVERLREELGRP